MSRAGDSQAGRPAADAGYGHTFRADSDSLRAALDATVLSATGQAVGVDADGRVVGVTSYDRLRAAIQRGRRGTAVAGRPRARRPSGAAGGQ